MEHCHRAGPGNVFVLVMNAFENYAAGDLSNINLFYLLSLIVL
jgi:hypothetical protein